jgi:general secretion pathway protein G
MTKAKSSNEDGFTLVELMVVIVILGILATVVVVNVFPATGQARATAAKADIASIESALEMYRLDNLTYPSSTDGLQALVAPPPGLAQPQRYRPGGYIKRLPDDPWGNPYRYTFPGQHGAFDVFSFGGDNKEGGEGENADIGNW